MPGNSKLLGLIPVGWFPGAIVFDASRKQIYVANLRGLSRANGPFNIGQYYNIPFPWSPCRRPKIWRRSRKRRWPICVIRCWRKRNSPRAEKPAGPVPERVGEPSVFQHVIYIIKENRTYDQILGDVKAGNGDAKPV